MLGYDQRSQLSNEQFYLFFDHRIRRCVISQCVGSGKQVAKPHELIFLTSQSELQKSAPIMNMFELKRHLLNVSNIVMIHIKESYI